MSDPLDVVIAAQRGLQAAVIALTAAYATAAVQVKAMDADERRRWDAGRDDWEADRWEDHCGAAGCQHECCERNLIPDGNPTLTAHRAILIKTLTERGFL